MKHIIVPMVLTGFVLTALLTGQVWGEETGAKAGKEFQSSLARGDTGRFQAVRMDESSVFILDTREGHCWLWEMSGVGTLSLLYGGRVFMGRTMGARIDKVPVAPVQGK